MTLSLTRTDSTSFTVTHARHIAAKVATDLKRMQRLYGSPTDSEIANYEAEVIELLKGGYIDTISYGFRRDNTFVEPTIRYTASELAASGGADDDPGRIRPGANVDGAKFYSYLTYSRGWNLLQPLDQQLISQRVPVQRGSAPNPSTSGVMTVDRTYSSGGRALQRASLRSS